MAITTVTALTAARMIEIEQASVVSGAVEGDQLILTTRAGSPITAGNVRGPSGPKGDPGGVVDATSTVNGGVRLAGNLKGTASSPQVTGNLDNTVDLSQATATATYNGVPNTVAMNTLVQSLLTIVDTYLKKDGSAITVWAGTEAQYTALPAGTKNAAGFIAVTTP